MALRDFGRGRHQAAVARLRPLVEGNSTPAGVCALLARALAEQGLFDELDELIEAAAKTSANGKLRAFAGALEKAGHAGWPTQSALRLVQYSPTVHDKGAGHPIPVPYQSTEIGPVGLPGFRDPLPRLRALPIDFAGKSVLDIGCNLGGFLFSLERALRWGVGIDNNPRNINVCQKLRSQRSAWTLDFYVHDIETQPLILLQHFLPEPTVDIVFVMRIMSAGSLSGLLRYAATIGKAVVFEPIHSHPTREADIATLKALFASVQIIQTDILEPLDGRPHVLYVGRHAVQ